MQIEFTTDRVYDGPQHVNVIVESTTKEEAFEGYVELVAVFTDSSRHITGRVVLPMMPQRFSNTLLEREVMASYDKGLYTAV